MRLNTFGGLSLESGNQSIPAPAFGPRRLALLALVAAAGARGISREKIIGILWSETDEEQARHTLSQTIYSIRREAGRGQQMVSGNSFLKLDPSLTSDVADFESALAADDLTRAVALYTGQFLEAFYVPGAPEFERWVDETRTRLHFAATKAIETLVRRANESGALGDAVAMCQRLTILDPLKSSHASTYIRALMATGDHVGALRFAREYESRVRRELDIELEPGIRELISQLKSNSVSTADVSNTSVAAATVVAQKGPVTSRASGSGLIIPAGAAPSAQLFEARMAAAESFADKLPDTYRNTLPRDPISVDVESTNGETPVTITPTREPVARVQDVIAKKPQRRLRRSVLVSAILVPALLAAAAWRFNALRPAALPGVPVLAVGAISSRGDTAEMGPIFRDMLATNLARVSGVRVVSNSRMIELSKDSPNRMSGVAAAAQRAGAAEMLEGEIAAMPDGAGVTLALRRVSVKSGIILQGYTVRAPDVFALADSATVVLAQDLHLDPPADAVANVRTKSAVAYALYERGLNAYYHADALSALELMTAALERDSTFAMAAAHAWRLCIIVRRTEQADRLLPVVKRLASRTIERERLWIDALVLMFTGSPITQSLEATRKLALTYPDDPEGQVLYGMALGGNGDFAASIEAFERAVAIDSASPPAGGSECRICEAFSHMSRQYISLDSLVAAERSARRLELLGPKTRPHVTELIESLLRQGRRNDADVVLSQLSKAHGTVPDFSSLLHRDMIRWGRLDELESRLVGELSNSPSGPLGEGPWLLQFVLRNQGRLREAHSLALDGTMPGNRVRLANHSDPLTQTIVAFERGDYREAVRGFRQTVDAQRSGINHAAPGGYSRHMAFRMTLLGTALAAAGDTAEVRQLADSVRRIGQFSSWARDHRLHHFLLGLVLQKKEQHAEAVTEFRQAVLSLSDGYTRINLELARSLIKLGRHKEAVEALRPALRGGVDGGNTYVTHTELHEMIAHAFNAAGQRDSAAFHYAAVERAWRKADPVFADRYRIARERAGQLRP